MTERAQAPEGVDRTDLALPEFGCRRCGETIGVYEPLAIAGEAPVRITSRAVEPDLLESGIYFHRACYEAAQGNIEANLRRSAWRRASTGARPA